jgi:hypothetical protein
MSRSRVTEVVNALVVGGVRSGVGLWVAHWGMSRSQAEAEVRNAGDPFPCDRRPVPQRRAL